MALEFGQTLLHYRLVDKIGEGGMGAVWKAVDENLDREVAIKILPEAFAQDPERLARFEREAKLLASLNHPSIAGIFGLHESDGTHFLAMEFVDGEDLAARMARGPIPTDQALDIARQIAEAVEAAHDQGVIHRDLKPANVLLTPGGQVKVLDFGLAKALEAPGSDSGDPSASPTITSLGTVAGAILGTAAYMSPEQARGHDADRRADVWSFGAVLYEMLAGTRPFEGDTISDTLAAVLRAEPDWDKLPTDTPPLIQRLVTRTLNKDVRSRTQSIGEARARIEEAIDHPHVSTEVTADTSREGSKLPWLIAAIALLIALGSLAAWQLSTPTPPPLLRGQIVMEPQANPAGSGRNLTLLPGGHRLLYYGGEEEDRRLWLRDFSQLESTPILGTEGGDIGAVSPDEQWFAFFADAKLKKISVNGGEPVVLADATRSTRGAGWSEDGYIYYAPGTRNPIMRVNENGGTPEAVTELGPDGNPTATTNSHRWPQILPGGKAVLYLAGNAGDFAQARVEVREIASGTVRVLQTGAFFPRYFDGHVSFVRNAQLMVMGFDVDTLTVTSPPVATIEDVSNAVGSGGAEYDVSDNGTLVYVPGQGTNTLEFEMNWVDRDTTSNSLVGAGPMFHPRISPDGKRIAYAQGLGSDSDIWVYDIQRGQSTRLTLEATASDRNPAWSADSKYLAFTSNRGGAASQIFIQPVDGSGEAVQLTTGNEDFYPTSWSSDGRMLLMMKATADRNFDTYLLRLDENKRPVGDPEICISTEGHDLHAVFSPDDKYVAYVSEEDDRAILYVRNLEGSARWQISDRAGWGPRWLPNGKLYFHAWDGQGWQGVGELMSVDFNLRDGVPVPGRPQGIREGRLDVVQASSTMFDFHPQDERLLMLTPTAESQFEGFANPVVIQGWVQDLKRGR